MGGEESAAAYGDFHLRKFLADFFYQFAALDQVLRHGDCEGHQVRMVLTDGREQRIHRHRSAEVHAIPAFVLKDIRQHAGAHFMKLAAGARAEDEFVFPFLFKNDGIKLGHDHLGHGSAVMLLVHSDLHSMPQLAHPPHALGQYFYIYIIDGDAGLRKLIHQVERAAAISFEKALHVCFNFFFIAGRLLHQRHALVRMGRHIILRLCQERIQRRLLIIAYHQLHRLTDEAQVPHRIAAHILLRFVFKNRNHHLIHPQHILIQDLRIFHHIGGVQEIHIVACVSMNDIVPAAGHAVEEHLLRRPLTLKGLLRQFAILELVVYP